jgi:hypothetical protein
VALLFLLRRRRLLLGRVVHGLTLRRVALGGVTLIRGRVGALRRRGTVVGPVGVESEVSDGSRCCPVGCGRGGARAVRSRWIKR